MQAIRYIKNMRRLFALLPTILSLAVIISFCPVNRQFQIQTAPQTTSRLPAAPRLAAYPFAGQPNITMYDEQLGTTFTQNFTSLAYTVTALDKPARTATARLIC